MVNGRCVSKGVDARDSGVGTNGLMLNYFQKKSRYEDEDEDEKELSGVSTRTWTDTGQSAYSHKMCATCWRTVSHALLRTVLSCILDPKDRIPQGNKDKQLGGYVFSGMWDLDVGQRARR